LFSKQSPLVRRTDNKASSSEDAELCNILAGDLCEVNLCEVRKRTGQAIQITIPGDAMFPPGAVPDGVNFVADLTIAADGAPQEIRLRP
jgi:hypothetical protein